MTQKNFAEQTNDAKTMIAGLRANEAVVAKRGLDGQFINTMEENLRQIQALDNEQEALKAALKTKTAELDSHLINLTNQLSEAKKVVKLSVNQEGWKEFGIGDKR